MKKLTLIIFVVVSTFTIFTSCVEEAEDVSPDYSQVRAMARLRPNAWASQLNEMQEDDGRDPEIMYRNALSLTVPGGSWAEATTNTWNALRFNHIPNMYHFKSVKEDIRTDIEGGIIVIKGGYATRKNSSTSWSEYKEFGGTLEYQGGAKTAIKNWKLKKSNATCNTIKLEVEQSELI